jgi:hypothetical protein
MTEPKKTPKKKTKRTSPVDAFAAKLTAAGEQVRKDKDKGKA